MTNYNDGNWWGWNGGECPVHPDTEVDAVTKTKVLGCTELRYAAVWRAGDFDWRASAATPIIAFRVTKEHRGPREWWLDPETGQAVTMQYGRFTVKLREVLDE